jgi:ABC-type nitrate/sulfonate/bicarbonate transport system substrate-binding protein
MKPYRTLLILLICCLPFFVVAQEAGGSAGKNPEKAEQKAAKFKAKHDQEALVGYQKSVKHQHKIQTKTVRKRMKKSLKESRREKPGHKDFFLKRWFTKKKRG